MKTLNPNFRGESFHFPDLKQADTILIEVWDWDNGNKHDFEGCAEIKIGNLIDELNAITSDTKTITLNLNPRPRSLDKITGTITFEAQWRSN